MPVVGYRGRGVIIQKLKNEPAHINEEDIFFRFFVFPSVPASTIHLNCQDTCLAPINSHAIWSGLCTLRVVRCIYMTLWLVPSYTAVGCSVQWGLRKVGT